ncbi:autotransporter outer membrane beta-barrel domain-containing protein [Avibacterium sp. 21-586]|uniref:autotransporter domain-containing protein n=1 Tax=Avibacterium sp. 21-586 TaxID=2911534 RepID=UPI00224639E8|nr:autotransporter domain-containing protein [Avibacterium sp. 21-586]MCW9709810.1 autotransporter outer membrane beta-barrel domain-containing protein [Avibacterium sp. 21-586]
MLKSKAFLIVNLKLDFASKGKPPLYKENNIHLSSEISWLHQLNNGEINYHLYFDNSEQSFISKTVKRDKNSLSIKLNADLDITKNSQLYLNYGNIRSSPYSNNVINAGWKFDL